jgi:hypothetical protein
MDVFGRLFHRRTGRQSDKQTTLARTLLELTSNYKVI